MDLEIGELIKMLVTALINKVMHRRSASQIKDLEKRIARVEDNLVQHDRELSQLSYQQGQWFRPRKDPNS